MVSVLCLTLDEKAQSVLQVEVGKPKKAKHYTYQRMVLVLALVLLILALCVFSLRYLWSPSLGKVRLNISSLFASH